MAMDPMWEAMANEGSRINPLGMLAALLVGFVVAVLLVPETTPTRHAPRYTAAQGYCAQQVADTLQKNP